MRTALSGGRLLTESPGSCSILLTADGIQQLVGKARRYSRIHGQIDRDHALRPAAITTGTDDETALGKYNVRFQLFLKELPGFE